MDNILELLKDATPHDMMFINRQLAISKLVTDIKIQYNIADTELKEKFNLDDESLKRFMIGTYNYSIEDLATLQVLERDKAFEKVEQIVEDRIQFPDYKYQEPVKPNS